MKSHKIRGWTRFGPRALSLTTFVYSASHHLFARVFKKKKKCLNISGLCQMLFWFCTVLQMVQNSAPCQEKHLIEFWHVFLYKLCFRFNNVCLFLSSPAPYTLIFLPCVLSFHPAALALHVLQVAGIKGVFLSNKVVENQVKTYITYNKGRDWRLLQAPATDLQGKRVDCEQVSVGCCRWLPAEFCSL